jgi:hypothetical protein
MQQEVKESSKEKGDTLQVSNTKAFKVNAPKRAFVSD